MQDTFAKELAGLVQKYMTPLQVSNNIMIEAWQAIEKVNLLDLDRARQGLIDEKNKAEMRPNEFPNDIMDTINTHLSVIVAVRTFRDTMNAIAREPLKEKMK